MTDRERKVMSFASTARQGDAPLYDDVENDSYAQPGRGQADGFMSPPHRTAPNAQSQSPAVRGVSGRFQPRGRVILTS